MRRLILALLLVTPLFLGLGDIARAELTQQQKSDLESTFILYCDQDSASFNEVTCEAWYNQLTQEEKDWVELRFLGLPDSRDSTAGSAASSDPENAAVYNPEYGLYQVLATMIGVTDRGTHKWEAYWTIKHSSLTINHWTWKVRHRWCAVEYEMRGCTSTLSMVTGNWKWDYGCCGGSGWGSQYSSTVWKQTRFYTTYAALLDRHCYPVMQVVSLPRNGNSAGSIVIEISQKNCGGGG